MSATIIDGDIEPRNELPIRCIANLRSSGNKLDASSLLVRAPARAGESRCRVAGSAGVPVQHGAFGARMAVEHVNEGPVTIVLD